MKDLHTINDVQIIYKPSEFPTIKVTQSQSALDACLSLIPLDQLAYKEFFGVLLLNRANRVVNKSLLSTGSISGTIVDVRHIMQLAILSNCSGMILFHNHPSGEVKPSEADLSITRKIKKAAELFDITLLDHLILSGYPDASPSYSSFADEGIL